MIVSGGASAIAVDNCSIARVGVMPISPIPALPRPFPLDDPDSSISLLKNVCGPTFSPSGEYFVKERFSALGYSLLVLVLVTLRLRVIRPSKVRSGLDIIK